MATESIPQPNTPLRSHLADFETTTSMLLREDEACAILNFAALLHEEIYLTDTALGDHRLLIHSFWHDRRLFNHVEKLSEAKILRVLRRDKASIRDRTLYHKPTISENYATWKVRDEIELDGESGYTTPDVPPEVRRAYNLAADSIISRDGVSFYYDLDKPKKRFRELVREPPIILANALTHLPNELRKAYDAAIEDEYFAMAKIWLALKKGNGGPEAIEVLYWHAHLNQQTYAEITGSGISGTDRQEISLASFNLELQRQTPEESAIAVTLEPPAILDAFHERAEVQLPSASLNMFARLSVDDIQNLRCDAEPLFALAGTSIDSSGVDALEKKYIKELEKYWHIIMDLFRRKFPEEVLRKNKAGLFLEKNVRTLSRIYEKYGDNFLPFLFQIPVSTAIGIAKPLSILLLQERNPEAKQLRDAVPPAAWRARGVVTLAPTSSDDNED